MSTKYVSRSITYGNLRDNIVSGINDKIGVLSCYIDIAISAAVDSLSGQIRQLSIALNELSGYVHNDKSVHLIAN